MFERDGTLLRQINAVFSEQYDEFISSGFYDAATKRSLLIPHKEVEPVVLDNAPTAYKTIEPTKVDFISYPYEWSFSQLKDAALVTLELQRLALEFGMTLRDASAYNIQFHRGKPIFIDTLSFEPHIDGRPWIAYQQFCKHFLAPLALVAHTHVELAKLLRVNIDGIPLDLAAALLPTRTKLSFSLLTHIHLHARSQRVHADSKSSADRAAGGKMSKTALSGLIDNLLGAVKRLQWNPIGTEWGAYYEATNYSDASFQKKKELIGEFIGRCAPKRVWDLGANTGVFSRIASDRGIETVAFDIDPAAVEANYRMAKENSETHILPLVLDLTNPSPAIGWDLTERDSVKQRGPVDTVLALALIHHLAISNNVPLDRLALFFHGLGRYLVIEFVPKEDSQVERLLRTREDIFPEYTRAGFEAAFARHFTIRDAQPIEGSERTLYLLEGI
jgi:ribosomal protein L11 methylase PrmA